MFDATGRVRPMFDAGWVESLLSCQCMNEKVRLRCALAINLFAALAHASTTQLLARGVTGCPARAHCARTKSGCVLSASHVESMQEARTSMIITKRQPFTQTVNHRGPVGEADAQAQYSDFLQDDLPDNFPGPVMSAPAMVFKPTRRKIPRSALLFVAQPRPMPLSLSSCALMLLHATSSTTGDKTARRHSVTGAETGVTTGLGDAAGHNLLGRGLSALLGVDIAPAEQSDFADDNRDPNKVVASPPP